MNEIIEKGQGTIYHEIGHLIGYILANKDDETKLGKVSSFELGLRSNCVIAENSFYHFEDIYIQRNQIKLNTSKVKRTVAWFVEVIAGCTFHAIFEQKDFKLCFEGHGNIDLSNLSAVRTLSAFTWTFDDIFEIQKDFENLIIKENIIAILEPTVKYLKTKLTESETTQLVYNSKNLEKFIEQIDQNLDLKFHESYKALIKKYSLRFNQLLLP